MRAADRMVPAQQHNLATIANYLGIAPKLKEICGKWKRGFLPFVTPAVKVGLGGFTAAVEAAVEAVVETAESSSWEDETVVPDKMGSWRR